MQIKILEIHYLKKHKKLVRFTSSIGKGVGHWLSNDKIKTGMDVNVELDIPGTLYLGKDILENEEHKERIYLIDEEVHIIGNVEQIEDDNILTIRIGKSIFLIEVEDKDKYHVGQWIEIKTKDLQLTNFIF